MRAPFLIRPQRSSPRASWSQRGVPQPWPSCRGPRPGERWIPRRESGRPNDRASRRGIWIPPARAGQWRPSMGSVVVVALMVVVLTGTEPADERSPVGERRARTRTDVFAGDPDAAVTVHRRGTVVAPASLALGRVVGGVARRRGLCRVRGEAILGIDSRGGDVDLAEPLILVTLDVPCAG